MVREIKDELNNLRKKSLELSEIAYDKDVPFEKAQELRKKQDETFKKMLFYKGFLNATEKVGKKK